MEPQPVPRKRSLLVETVNIIVKRKPKVDDKQSPHHLHMIRIAFPSYSHISQHLYYRDAQKLTEDTFQHHSLP
jgi:hypothetical protein